MLSAMDASTPQPVVRQPPRPPPPAVAAEEQQWIFCEEELLETPSIIDGMSPDEERHLRRKGIGFLIQVGMSLKLPQTLLSTAAVFFNRYLMRKSLKAKPGYKPMHHYQLAATCLFLAAKVEENSRKIKDLVVACVRVALKDPNKLVDEQTKDYWRWRDIILFGEDQVLETLCFDISIEQPFKTMYEILSYYGLEHDKRIRNSSWAFLSDSVVTELCLLFTSRTMAAASVYAGARHAGKELPNDELGRPWWETLGVKLRDISRACSLMADIYDQSPPKDGEASNIYTSLKTPDISFDTPGSLKHGDSGGPQPQVDVEMKNGSDVANGTTGHHKVTEANAQTNAPETHAPETHAPETLAPETLAPETNAPQPNAPQPNAPDDVSEEGELDG